MTAARPSVAVVEDDGAVREGLQALLESWGFAVQGYADAEALLAEAGGHGADCLLLDVRLPGLDGVALVRALRQGGDATPILMMSAHADVAVAVDALRAGAQDFLEKPFDEAPLIDRINALVAAQASAAPGAALAAGLTPRETEVFREVVAGHSNKVIAHRLGISPKTVEMHRARVMKKTGARSVAELVRMSLDAADGAGAGPQAGGAGFSPSG